MKSFSHTFIDSQGNHLEYACYGEGKKVIICFPGFAESHESFRQLSSQLVDYTLIGINLYGVGHSLRHSRKRPLSHEEWYMTLNELVISLKLDRFSVLGFSLGGRFAISTFYSFHDQIQDLILIAADGIQKRFTYELATFPLFFRQLFYYLMRNPEPYYRIVGLLHKLKLINSYVANFSKSQMKDENKRILVYKSWVGFKRLRLSQRILLELIEKHPGKIVLMFGEKDRIIDPKKHVKFLKKLDQRLVEVLPYGHNKLVDNASQSIVSFLGA